MAHARETKRVNNAFFDTIGTNWISGNDHPAALLRAESPVKLDFIRERIKKTFGNRSVRILDLGCGGGLLSNALAQAGHSVTAIDLAPHALEFARLHDSTSSVSYLIGDAMNFDRSLGTFDVVCAMDLLEHVEHPEKLIRSAARVISPGGLFTFHTFNRSVAAWLLAIKGLEWFVKNTPPNLHVYDLFIKPAELKKMLVAEGFEPGIFLGIRPKLSRSLFGLLATRRVPDGFTFCLSRFKVAGYIGSARQRAA